MGYQIRQDQEGTWEVYGTRDGKIAKLGGMPLKRLDHDEAVTGLEMLQSRFQQDARKKQLQASRNIR